MKLERNGRGFAVQIPDDVVARLGLAEGDDVEVQVSRVPVPLTKPSVKRR